MTNEVKLFNNEMFGEVRVVMKFHKQGFLFSVLHTEGKRIDKGHNCFRTKYIHFDPDVRDILDNCFSNIYTPTLEECVMLDLTHGQGNAKVWCDMLREFLNNKHSFLLPADENFNGSYTRSFVEEYIKIPEGY